MTRTRDALVADVPGVTRDRQYGYGRSAAHRFIVVDTGGLVASPRGIEQPMAEQTRRAIGEAGHLVLVVDGREGLQPADRFVAEEIRRSGKPVVVAVNKSEGRDDALAVAEFHALGLGEPRAVAATHAQGVDELVEAVLADVEPAPAEAPEPGGGGIRVCVVGRPNVGKSTLINRLIGEDRLIAFDEPGTTRDTILVPFERDGRRFTLIDTAGVRRRARVEDAVEKFSVIKTLQAIEDANVVIGVLDARDSVAEQDATLLGIVADRGRALVIAVNKWDHVAAEQRAGIRDQLATRLRFLEFAPVHFVSALHGSGVGELMESVQQAYQAAMRELATPVLTRVLEGAIQQHQPPLVRGRRIKLRYAHQGGRNPPVIVVHGTQAERTPEDYRRYLGNCFRQAFDLRGTPLRVEFKSEENPFAGRRNKLTPRQLRSRRRAVRHPRR
jgi:GTP-binding protein